MKGKRLLLPIVGLTATGLAALAQGTAFTYQGRLNDGANPAGGSYDLKFGVFDSATGGTLVSSDYATNSATTVSGGLFMVTLDFGDVFAGPGRWLEIAVRTNGGGAFSTLSPRQQLTSTPYAIRATTANFATSAGSANNATFATNATFANSANSADNAGHALTATTATIADFAPRAGRAEAADAATTATTANIANFVPAAGIQGAINPGQLSVPVVINGASGVTLSGAFSGNGQNLTTLNASQLAFGTVPDARLSANVALRSDGNTFTGNQNFTGGGAIIMLDNAVDIYAKNSSGQAEGLLTGRWSDNATYFTYGSGGLFIRNNVSVPMMFVSSSGNVGIGTTAPDALLSVNGSASKPGGGSWSSFSDQRLKKNIRPLAGALDKLLALHGVNFEYIDPARIHELSGERMGLLAQEVEKVFPDWVETGADGYKRVTVRGLEALVVESLRQLRQEQQNAEKENGAAIQGLDRKLAQKETEITELNARLEKLERWLNERE